MSAEIHNFPDRALDLAVAREVLRCEHATPAQIAMACAVLETSPDWCDRATVRGLRGARPLRDDLGDDAAHDAQMADAGLRILRVSVMCFAMGFCFVAAARLLAGWL